MTFLLRPGIFKVEIVYPIEGLLESENFRVDAVAPGRLQVMESSGLFSSYRLLCGDEIEVRQVGERKYELIRVIQPSAMCHYFSVIGVAASGTDGVREALDHAGFTRVLHELGGEWEADMGGLLTVHVPRGNREALESRTGWRIVPDSEVFSGPADLSFDE